MTRPFHGCYINLDRAVDRRAAIENELHRYRLTDRYSRIAAIDGRELTHPTGAVSAGEYACFASHVEALAPGLERSEHLHILEDDAVLSPSFVPEIGHLCEQNMFEKVDLMFTDIAIRPDSLTVAAFEKACGGGDISQQPTNVVDLKNVNWACTTSYMVAKRSIADLHRTLKADLQAGPALPIDLRIRQLVNGGRFRAAVCLPFLTSINLIAAAESSIGSPDRSGLVTNIIRHAFFKHVEPEILTSALERFCSVGPMDGRRNAMLQSIAVTMFGEFRMP